jgi:BirA family transcriptional regulator, biotin operon repressor / biotin---[acetyl-CoA-carboxylase] ligase
MTKSRESELLHLLQETDCTYSQLETRLRCSPHELEKAFRSLTQGGLSFSKDQDRIRLAGEPDRLLPETILARLQTSLIGNNVVVLHETSSTNDRVRQAGDAGHPPGLVVLAETQTAGRGQYGRKWESPPGTGIWGSILLATNDAIEDSTWLQAAALATAEALEQWIWCAVHFKKPNDLVIGHAKLAGFLLENIASPPYRVLGFGINIRSAPNVEGRATTYADRYCSGPVNRASLLADILNRLDRWQQHPDPARLRTDIARRESLENLLRRP